MKKNPIYIGNTAASFPEEGIKGELIVFEGENYYKISNYNAMRPFFMSIVSDSNHWMFISSTGGLTAGRQNAESALFPYYTDDKITESADITGNKTIVQVHAPDRTFLWEPFSESGAGLYKIRRNLYKNTYGNKLVFEEVNENLELIFRYQWNSSDRFGFVKKSTIINLSDRKVQVTLLDGVQNILPYGVTSDLQNRQSNLVDAYKKNELDTEIGLGIYALSAIIVDKAEPSEALKATTVWSTGLENAKYLLSSLQLETFRKGGELIQEQHSKAEKGAYFICTELTLAPKQEKSWMIIADVNRSMVDISEISYLKKNEKKLFSTVEYDIELGSKRLLQLNSAADGLQLTADELRNTRHFSNTLFNIMRGGIFNDNYQIEKWDFLKYLRKANSEVFSEMKEALRKLPGQFSFDRLKKFIKKVQDAHFNRLAVEYMPLKFSRRHGDPSRPWNRFSINTIADDGSKILDYEGNWRDIFQNWEALAHAYPEFIESMIFKFLNATTFDGYNPYRVTKDGFDWETVEEDNPWSYIGYWGDHQIIYLLKLLEFSEKHFPNKLTNYLHQNIFVYANVPYKIKSYASILANPKDTIAYDTELDAKINRERNAIGADGALFKDRSGGICRVNLLEKLLATVLAKISNFIPEGGIWMNTQRPEWNDANNALVGNGVSMVTLCYLRRFLVFFEKIVVSMPHEYIAVSKEMVTFFSKVKATFEENESILAGKISNADRRTIMDGLGRAGSEFRDMIYSNGFSTDRNGIAKDDLVHFLKLSTKYLDHSIDTNQRSDNLFHSYNIMTVESRSEVSISHLSEMLEGQVAVLSSGYISAKESLEVLNALKKSALFRPDQYSYLLYPNKELPRFSDKNNISSEKVAQSPLLQRLLENGNVQVIEKDVQGHYHFNGSFNNAESLKKALSQLPQKEYGAFVEKEIPVLLEIFEEIFDHKSFTGRSGTFFGYEGLGSIYWHMVSKLLLAVQETCVSAVTNKEEPWVIGGLFDHYHEINEGIGVHKSPGLYGAFPTDPYSHTPAGKGAQQPGMTGQVKEDILSRFGELGVNVADGKLGFDPHLLRKEEFLTSPKTFVYTNLKGVLQKIALEEGSLCFTYCQIPIVYRRSEKEGLQVVFNENSILEFDKFSLDSQTSQGVFGRTGEISKIIVSLKLQG